MPFHPVFCGGLLIAVLATLCTSQWTVPPDPKNCKLNYTAPFSWVVLIYDKHKLFSHGYGTGAATQGAQLTYKSIITTASYFLYRQDRGLPDAERYSAIGHRIWDWRNNGTNARTNPCTQTRKIRSINPHPKAQESAARRFIFDYAIVVMDTHFSVSPPIFPTMFYPSSPYEMILNVQYVNVKNELECAIPIPDNDTMVADRQKLIINKRIDFSTVKFHRECINLICELKNRKEVSKTCKQVLENRPNATMLCLRPTELWTTRLLWGPGEKDSPYAGTPYTCNGSTLGIVTQHKRRGSNAQLFNPPNYDFFVVVTFLRVWNWFIEKSIEYSPSLTPFYIETASLRRESFQEPYREPVPGNMPTDRPHDAPPFRYPDRPYSGAPSMIRISSPVLNAFFAIVWITF